MSSSPSSFKPYIASFIFFISFLFHVSFNLSRHVISWVFLFITISLFHTIQHVFHFLHLFISLFLFHTVLHLFHFLHFLSNLLDVQPLVLYMDPPSSFIPYLAFHFLHFLSISLIVQRHVLYFHFPRFFSSCHSSSFNILRLSSSLRFLSLLLNVQTLVLYIFIPPGLSLHLSLPPSLSHSSPHSLPSYPLPSFIAFLFLCTLVISAYINSSFSAATHFPLVSLSFSFFFPRLV